MSRCIFSLKNDCFSEVTEWKGELRVDLREWKDEKPTKKRYQPNLDAMEELGGLLRICGSSKDRETKLYESSWRERLLNHHRGQRIYGYKAVLEATRKGDTYEKGIIPETPRIHCRQRTLKGNWNGLTRTRQGRTLLRAK